MADRVIRLSSYVDTRGIDSGIGRMNSRLSSFESAWSRSNGIGGYVDSVVTGLAKAGLAYSALKGIVGGITSVVSAPLKLAAAAEQTQVSFEVMTGSVETATALVESLRVMGAKTPFEFADLSSATSVLLSFGRTNSDVLQDLDMLSNVASGNKDKLSGLAVVYGQVASAGKLMGGDVLQMINQGFNPLNEIAKRTGESMSDLRDRMSKGKVGFDEVRQAFQDATSAGGLFYQMNEKQSATIGGVWSTMQDEISSTLLAIGVAIDKSFDVSGILESVAAVASAFKTDYLPSIMSSIDWTLNLVTGFFDFSRICSTLIPVIGGVVAVLATVVAVQKAIAVGQAIVLALSGPTGWATLAAGAAVGYAAYSQLSGVFKDISAAATVAKTDVSALNKAFEGAKTNEDFIAATDKQVDVLNEERKSKGGRTRTGASKGMSDEEYNRRLDQILQAETDARNAADKKVADEEEKKKPKAFTNEGVDKKIKAVTDDLMMLQGTATDTSVTLQEMIDSGASPEKVAQLKKLMDQLERSKNADAEQKKLQGLADKIKQDTRSTIDQLEESFDELEKLHNTLDKDGNPLISFEQLQQAQMNGRSSLLSGLIPEDEWTSFNKKAAELKDLLAGGWIDEADLKKGILNALPSEIKDAIDASKTPIQKYQEYMSKLQRGVDEGQLTEDQKKKSGIAALPQTIKDAIDASKSPLQKYKEQIAELDSFAGQEGVTPEVLDKAKDKIRQDIFGGGESDESNPKLARMATFGSSEARDTLIRHQMRFSGAESKNDKLLTENQKQTELQKKTSDSAAKTAVATEKISKDKSKNSRLN